MNKNHLSRQLKLSAENDENQADKLKFLAFDVTEI